MNIFKLSKRTKRINRRNDEVIPIQRYAPDVTFTAVDYSMPLPEERIKAAESRIREFLNKSSPDSYCADFFDRLNDRETRCIIGELDRQTPGHREAIIGITSKHRAELARLNHEITETEALIDSVKEQIARLRALYQRVNSTPERMDHDERKK